MKHYVCSGECGGVSETPGVCQADSCSHHNQPLLECDCEDGKHEKILKRNKEEEKKEEAE